jgi:type IV secretion system protein VirB4
MSLWPRCKPALVADRLPYAFMDGEERVILRDGSLMLAISVPGLAFETADVGEVNAHAALREVMLRGALDARFLLYHHIIRRRVGLDFAGAFPDPVSRHIDACWHARLEAGEMFINEQFITLVRRPARGKAGLIDRLSRQWRKQANRQPDPADIRVLHAAADALLASLAPYGARILGGYDAPAGRCSEPLELLSALFNGEMRPVRRPVDGTDIAAMLPYRRISFGRNAIEMEGAGGTDFAALISLKDYPDSTPPGLTDPMLRLPHELVLTESFAPCDRQTARERMDLALRQSRAADEDAVAERSDLHAARDALGIGAIGFGDHHLSVLVRHDTLDGLDRAVAQTASALADAGAIAVREDINLEAGFWGQMPGNEGYLVRRAMISTANMACFGALHGFAMGEADGNHWGQAVALLQTTSSTPYFFNFHQGDLGNFTVIGPSGSGKTVVLNFLAAQARRFAPRLFLFDKDRGSEVFVRATGGRYSRIAAGHPTGFNPLALADTPTNRAFLRAWLAVLLQADGPQEEADIAHAVDALYANDPALRRLAHFRELIAGAQRPRPGDLASRLAPWIGDGPHSWLFDHPDDRLELRVDLQGFDMTALLEQPALRTPVLMYLFHRIEERLDGRPTLILIDEGWKALDDPVFAARIRDWLKTLRKRNALVGFATQSARDALDSSIATALVEQTATMLFLPNARARAEDYADGFGLTQHEVDIIRTLPPQSRCFLVKQAEASAVVRLDLSGLPEVLCVLSGRESVVRQLDHLRNLHGDAPEGWYQALTGAPWPGEASLRAEAAE